MLWKSRGLFTSRWCLSLGRFESTHQTPTKTTNVFLDSTFISKTIQRDPDPKLRSKTFLSVISDARAVAARSVHIEVRNVTSAEAVYEYCIKEMGPVKSMHYQENKIGPKTRSFFLVEFESAESLALCLDKCRFPQSSEMHSFLPTSSHFMWYSHGKGSPRSQPKRAESRPDEALPLHYYPCKDIQQILQEVGRQNSLDKQIIDLHEHLRMTELGTRLRFLACHQLEYGISSLFRKARVYPFGSSVNSFGTNSSDLDMILSLKDGDSQQMNTATMQFHVKASQSRYPSQQVQHLAYAIEAILPGCHKVISVPHARVPIVKYYHELLGLDCDLTIDNMYETGYHMAELLHTFGELDQRIRPLVFFFRLWAAKHEMTEAVRPTRFFTNFTLLTMMFFFLQHHYQMIPAISKLRELADQADETNAQGKLGYTSLADISGLQPKLNACYNRSELSITEILFQFFIFFAEFNASANAICLTEGKLLSRSTNREYFDQLHIINPFEPGHNIAGNVKRLAEMQLECGKTAIILKEMMEGKREQDITQLLTVQRQTLGKFKLSTVFKDMEKEAASKTERKPQQQAPGKSRYSMEKRRKDFNAKYKRLV